MRRAFLLAILPAAAGILLAGCGGAGVTPTSGADLANGKAKFIASCGGCHTMVDASAQGKAGPNLDDAFKYSADQGFEDSTFVQVVREQIRYPGQDNETAIQDGAVQMPSQDDLGLSDKDADDIAVYVGTCYGADVANQCQAPAPPPPAPAPPAEPGGAEPPADGDGSEAGAAVFAEAGCATCHTLAAAGATGAVGPNLDELAPGKEQVAAAVANGKGAMPAFGGRLSPEQIDQVAEFVAGAAGQ